MVQQLSSPRLITDSMGAGGTVHQSFSMGAPGSTPVDPPPQVFETLDLADVAIPAGRDPVIPNQPGRDGMGRFSSSEPAQGGGWKQVEGLSR